VNQQLGRETLLFIDFSCEARADGVQARMALSGEIDTNNADQVARVVATALREHRPHRLSVDLSGVTFLGIAGVRALVAGRTQAERTGCALRIDRPSRIAGRMLSLWEKCQPRVRSPRP